MITEIPLDGGKKIKLIFNYNRGLVDEVKAMEGRKWNPEDKTWTVPNTKRNRLALDIIAGKPVLNKFRQRPDITPITVWDHFNNKEVSLYAHQCEVVHKARITGQHIIAFEMGLGKTLCAFNIVKGHGVYVAPKNVMPGIRSMMRQWQPRATFDLINYDEFRANWTKYRNVDFIIFDESQKLKNAAAARTQAALLLCEELRERNPSITILLMTGTPAPKNPVDWWAQCEVAFPGYLRESDAKKLTYRLAEIEQTEGLGGNRFPKFKRWYADEVSAFYRRLSGLVTVKLKKDCLDLPPKMYQERRLEPSAETLEYAKLIRNTAPRAITAMIMLRQLSDGFQYVKMPGEGKTCHHCNGAGKRIVFAKEVRCDDCDATGILYPEVIEAQEVGSPKDDALRGILEECEEKGRIVIYAGYKASVDRCVRIAQGEEWKTIQVDGRGWFLNGSSVDGDTALELFNTDYENKYAFIGHPASAGVGLTLTAADTIVYFSNDFSGEARMQSEDRIHRIGMKDKALIIDLIHLPIDKYVLTNLQRKKDLQAISMGELNANLASLENSS